MSRICSRYSCESSGMETFSLDLVQAVKNIAGCESVEDT